MGFRAGLSVIVAFAAAGGAFWNAPPLHAGTASAAMCAVPTTAPGAVVPALDALLNRIVTGTEVGAAPGGVVSVKGPGWRYIRSVGMADPDAGIPVDCEMPFQIGSNTKMMTAVVLLQLHEEGRLGIDDPLSRHLPDVAARIPNGGAMTLRQLAQHTSGIFSYSDNAPDGTPGLMEQGLTDPVALRRHLEPQDMIDFVADHGTPTFAPGEAGRWSYSNTGYTLLGMVIEKIEGKAIDESFETRIFTPLGMTETYMWNGIPRKSFGLPRSWLAAPYDYETTEWNMSQGAAAGGVISTVDDMHLFIEALVAGRLFRSPETLALMQQGVPSDPGVEYGIGLKRLGDGQWGHDGQTLGYISIVNAFETKDISIVAWGNTSLNPLAYGATDITDALVQAGVIAQ